MKIDGKIGARESLTSLMYVGISFEHRSESRLDNRGQSQIRPELFQQRESGRGEYAVAQRAQPDHRDPRAGRQAIEQFLHVLFFDTSFVDQHYGNIVANRINALALDALQAIFILLQFERRLAQGTD